MNENLFLQLFLILVTARLFSELFARVGIPSVLGELGAGVLLGGSLLGLISTNETLEMLAGLGVMLLLFEVGMESDIKRLGKAGPTAVVIAFLGAVIPLLLGYAISRYLFELEEIASLFVAGTLTATSIGITLRVLRDLGQHEGNPAQVVIGAAVLDDIIGVVLLVLAYDLAMTGEISYSNTIQVLLVTVAFFFIAMLAAYLLGNLINIIGPDHRIPGFETTLIVSLIFLFGYIAHLLDVPEILGSFAAGIALSKNLDLPVGIASRKLEYHYFLNHVRRNINPIIALLTPIFFVMVGVSLDLSLVDLGSLEFWLFTVLLFVVSVFGKVVGALPFRSFTLKERLVIGFSMTVRGEVGLIFANLGAVNGVLQASEYAVLLVVIALTTLFPPLWIKWLHKNS